MLSYPPNKSHKFHKFYNLKIILFKSYREIFKLSLPFQYEILKSDITIGRSTGMSCRIFGILKNVVPKQMYCFIYLVNKFPISNEMVEVFEITKKS